MVAGHCAGRCPDLINRIVFFGPIAQRSPTADAPRLPAWRLITLQDQWDRFTADCREKDLVCLDAVRWPAEREVVDAHGAYAAFGQERGGLARDV